MLKPKINLLIVEDHEIMIDGLKLLIAEQEDLHLVGATKQGIEALELLKTEQVDVAVVDISMPNMNGEELTKRIKKEHPQVKVLVLSMHREAHYVAKMIAVNIDGYILKDNGEKEFVNAIRCVVEKGSYYDQEIAHVIATHLRNENKSDKVQTTVSFTRREKEVLALVGQGLAAKEIAQRLHIQKSTVETHKVNLRDKLGFTNSKELMRYAIREGYTGEMS